MNTLSSFYKDKKIFLTGHTGFKGAWLLEILFMMGAKVKGYSLPPEKEEDLFQQIKGEELCEESVFADIRDIEKVKQEIQAFQPDIIFHLAAQPLVRRSYNEPVYTFDTNVMGTVHVLEAMRELKKPCIAVMITTDKVYENQETGRAFIESDKLGGYDPYSASKAATEIAIASYQKSYFSADTYSEHQKAIVAMRAGNVIGGGDFADDRIIPDIVRAIQKEESVLLRNPQAVRPWQHVLEPLAAYLLVARLLSTEKRKVLLPAYNIGPEKEDVLTVETVTQIFIEAFGKGDYEIHQNSNQPHEANLLLLDNTAIKNDLSWQPHYDALHAIKQTAAWYADKANSARQKTEKQIETYFSLK